MILQLFLIHAVQKKGFWVPLCLMTPRAVISETILGSQVVLCVVLNESYVSGTVRLKRRM